MTSAGIINKIGVKQPNGARYYLAYTKKNGWHLARLNLWQRICRRIFGIHKKTHLRFVAKKLSETDISEVIKSRIRLLWYKTYPSTICPLPPFIEASLLAGREDSSKSKNLREFHFIGRKQPLADLRGRFVQLNDPIRKGIDKVQANYDFYEIAADGHCLFRAVAAGMLLILMQNEAKTRLLVRFDRLLDQIAADADLRQSGQVFKETIGRLDTNTLDLQTQSFFQCMDNRECSDALVAFLRKLAVTYGRSDVTLRNVASPEVWARMCTMGGRPEMGGHLELQALSKALQISFQVINLKEVGNDRPLNAGDHFHVPDAAIGAIFLLFYDAGDKSHWDLAVPKIADK